MNRKITGVIFFLISAFSAQAQFFGSKDDEHGRVWNIRFVLDGGMIPLSISHQESYQGEYYGTFYNPDSSTYQEWVWSEWATDTVFDLQDVWPNTIRLGVMVNVVKDLFVGVSYSGHFFRINQRIDGRSYSWRTVPFGTLEGAINYSLPLTKSRRLFLQPTLYGGTYQSDSYEGYEGVGRETAIGGRLAFAVRVHRKYQHMFRIWVANHQLIYKEHEPSFVYENRIRAYDSRWGVTNMGFGLLFHIGIKEDKH